MSLAPIIYKPLDKPVVTAISAQLFYKNKEEVSITKPIESVVNNSEIKTTHKVIKDVPPNEIRNSNKSLAKQVEKKAIVVESKNQIDVIKSLESLREKINSKIYQQNAEQAYKNYIASKNFIPRSTTKFNKLPEAKAVKIEVDCTSAVNKSIRVISGLLGGSIKCNSFNGSQKFIDARLEKLGKNKTKKKN